ncbi:hypothetical protein BJ742DRAFT_705616 [Cladochytrium replicatum]|nr:hypothetical protein BJ742DRAFT_705616 [Cladochytrium replicatum]
MEGIIRLLDSGGEKVLDSVSAEYEDSFCLDTFGDLIKAHRASSKCFILARVQTWDHKQPEKAFYSYYDAFQLNKTLFQTQQYLSKKLIHRLHVLNPLTNTDIIGNVSYFMVKPGSQQEAKPDATTKSDVFSHKLDTPDPELQPSKTLEIEAGMYATKKRATVDPIITQQLPLTIDIPPATPAVREIEKGEPATWTLGGPSVSAEEENPPRRPSLGVITRRLSLSPTRRMSLSPRRKSAPLSAPVNRVILPLSPIPATNPTSDISNQPAQQPRRHTSYNAETMLKPPPSLVPTTIHAKQQQKIIVPPGKITRFTLPVPTDELQNVAPPTAARRRRSLSYVNAVSASGVKASFQEWLEMVSEESPHPEQDFDVVKPFGSSAVTTEPLGTTAKSPKTAAPVIYDALLFATDNDFLETSKTRAIFKENALQPEDAKLFEMPPYTGESEPAVIVIVDEPSLCDWCYPDNEELANSSYCLRLFHRLKCYLVVGIILGAMLALIFITLRQGGIGK